MHWFLKFIFGIKLYMFQTVPLSIIRIFFTVRWLGSAEPVPSWSCSQAVYKPLWHIPLLCVQWKIPDDGQMNCPKHVEFYFKNKFEKFVHVVVFIIRIYHVARSPELQNLTFWITLACRQPQQGLDAKTEWLNDRQLHTGLEKKSQVWPASGPELKNASVFTLTLPYFNGIGMLL